MMTEEHLKAIQEASLKPTSLVGPLRRGSSLEEEQLAALAREWPRLMSERSLHMQPLHLMPCRDPSCPRARLVFTTNTPALSK